MTAMDDYKEALKWGEKAYREALAAGDYPYLPALDEMITLDDVETEISLGLVEIPMDQIVGTKTAGRQTAFARNFMPLLSANSEFGYKWIGLCDSLQEEGLRDSIKAYEYMNRFYILEGNKRVSVMKYLGSMSIPGQVIRVVPKEDGTLMNRVYYEFMAFYRYAKINYLNFTKPGSYARLVQLAGKGVNEAWSEDETRDFHSFYIRFKNAYQRSECRNLLSLEDALLVFLGIYPYQDALCFMPVDFKVNIAKSREEFRAVAQNRAMALSMEPADQVKKNMITKLISGGGEKKIHKIAFIYDKNPENSSWIYGHELGRRYLEQVYPDRITTLRYEDIDALDTQKVSETIEDAIARGCELIFTATPKFLAASLKAAVDHPQVKILNCSIHTRHPSLRTYYGRMYEAKFLLGAIAGAMSENDHIGYIADYPIYGMTANINAFALGAKMTNPRAKVELAWSTIDGMDVRKQMREKGICFISDRDMIVPNMASREFGLYQKHADDDAAGVAENMATPVWHWGRFYELILKSIKSGSWKNEGPASGDDSNAPAVNYWWGMSAGVIDLICSSKLPEGTRRLVELLRQNIISGSFHPFSGKLYDQSGVLRHDSDDFMLPNEIITMDWLADNVIGHIPSAEELTEEARQVVEIQGIGR